MELLINDILFLHISTFFSSSTLIIGAEMQPTVYFLKTYSEMWHNEATGWCVRQNRLQCDAGETHDREIQESYE